MGQLAEDTNDVKGLSGGKQAQKQRQPSAKVTPLHWFYLFVWNGCGALIIAGGANFGIATGIRRLRRLP